MPFRAMKEPLSEGIDDCIVCIDGELVQHLDGEVEATLK